MSTHRTVCAEAGCPELIDSRCWCWEHIVVCYEDIDCAHPAHVCEEPGHYCRRHGGTG